MVGRFVKQFSCSEAVLDGGNPFTAVEKASSRWEGILSGENKCFGGKGIDPGTLVIEFDGREKLADNPRFPVIWKMRRLIGPINPLEMLSEAIEPSIIPAPFDRCLEWPISRESIGGH
jgi:hypothetical protein